MPEQYGIPSCKAQATRRGCQTLTSNAGQGREGIAIAKTKQAIIIGHHPDTAVAGNANATVENLADYLIGQGY